MKPFSEDPGAQGIAGARSGRASGGTPEKPGFCEAKMCTNDYGFHFGTGTFYKNLLKRLVSIF
jgi:hypothetical protein